MDETMDRAIKERDEAQNYRDGYVGKAEECLLRNDYGGFAMYADRAKQMEVLRRVIDQRIINPDG